MGIRQYPYHLFILNLLKKKSLIWAVCFSLAGSANERIGTKEIMALTNLRNYKKAECLQLLEKASEAELWDALLEGQAQLCFDAECQWIAKEKWWGSVQNVLEIGCGNGAFLAKLADQFPTKSFRGIEKLASSLDVAKKRNSRQNIHFQQGDAEIFDPSLVNSADVMIFRLVLQHLSDPLLALKNSSQYLTSDGYVLIIDAYDQASRNSHPITAIEEALKLAAEYQRTHKTGGNRRISLDLLKLLEDDQNFQVVFSNLDADGHILHEIMRHEGKRARQLYFNNGLLFLTLVHRTYKVPVNVDKAYDELNSFLEDEQAWSSMGMHFLVLKKRGGV